MRDFTTTRLITDVRRRGSLPESSDIPSAEDIIAFLNDAQDLAIIPAIMRTREEFFVDNADYVIAGSEGRFRLPERAIGNRVRAVQVLDAQGALLQNVPRVDPVQGELDVNLVIPRGIAGYYFEANEVVLNHENPESLGPTLRLKYYRRPGYLVPVEEAAQVVSIAGPIITVDKQVSAFAAGVLVDGIGGVSPFDTLVINEAIVAVGAFSVELSAAAAAKLSVGDWISLAQESPIPQFPKDLHPLFVQYALVKIFDSIGDENAAAGAQKDMNSQLENLYELVDDRDDGSPQVAFNRNGIFDYDDYGEF